MFRDRSTLACMVVASYLYYPKQLETALRAALMACPALLAGVGCGCLLA
jgi:hypothetical protein